MHDLEKRIQEWRRVMRTRLGAEAVEELEGHLRDAMDGFSALGRSEVEAFELAARQLGSVEEISAEYEKRSGGTWWAIKAANVLAVVGVLGFCVFAVAIGAGGGPVKWLLATHVFTVTIGFVGTFMIGGLGICYVCQRMWREFSPTVDAKVMRAIVSFGTAAAALTAVGTGLAMIWAKIEWGRFWAWDYKETGALAILTWLLFFVVIGRARVVRTRGLMSLAIVGNIVVLFGWFAAHSMELRQWNAAQYGMIVGGTTFHLIFAAVGFLPAGIARRLKA